jgi:hypothetical protein
MRNDERAQALIAERAAEDLYRVARICPENPRGAAALARAVLGKRCIRIVPRNSIPKSALVWDRRHPVIQLCEGLNTRELNHCAAHELSEWHLRVHNYHGPEPEELAGRIAASLCVPAKAFFAARAALGDNLGILSQAFAVSESLMALRFAECLGSATALITPTRVRTRGAPWAWPSTPEAWRELVMRAPNNGLHVQRLRDARGRVVIRQR